MCEWSEPDVDAPVREAHELGDLLLAADRALSLHGREVLGFLTARARCFDDGEHAFTLFAEDLWRGIGSFTFPVSVRCWLYALSLHAAERAGREPNRRRPPVLPLRLRALISELVHRARDATWQARSQNDEELRKLRQRLPVLDQTLLILHVDRRLPWRELARVLGDRGQLLEGALLDAEATRLREHFEGVRTRLRELAVAAGLLHQ